MCGRGRREGGGEGGQGGGGGRAGGGGHHANHDPDSFHFPIPSYNSTTEDVSEQIRSLTEVERTLFTSGRRREGGSLRAHRPRPACTHSHIHARLDPATHAAPWAMRMTPTHSTRLPRLKRVCDVETEVQPQPHGVQRRHHQQQTTEVVMKGSGVSVYTSH